MNKEQDHDQDDDLQDSNESFEQSSNQDVLAIVKRMQQQLGFLEKKIDQLLGQGGGNVGARPFRGGRDRDRNFSKPFRPSFHRGGGDRGGHRRGGDRDARGGGFGDRPRGEGFDRDRGGFGGGQRKPFRRRREEE